tara:strand:- start:259 stop:486 length:228 start_codon:yes stop_codon:yes gene_type:complete
MSRLQKLDAEDLKTGAIVFHLLLLELATADDNEVVPSRFERLVQVCPESIEILTGLGSQEFEHAIRAVQFNSDNN